MVKRFIVEQDSANPHNDPSEMVEDPGGEWVRFEDFDRVERELDARHLRLDQEESELAFRLKRCEEDRDLYRRQRDHADAELARLISGIERIAGRGGGIVSVDYALEVVGHIKALHVAARAEVERRERAAGELLEELHGVAEELNELHARLAIPRAHLGEPSNATADNDLLCGDNGGLLPSQTCVLRRGHRGEHISYGGRRWGPR